MEILGIYSFLFTIIIFCFGIGAFFALPMIWYHIGYVSRKLDKTNEKLTILTGKISKLVESKE